MVRLILHCYPETNAMGGLRLPLLNIECGIAITVVEFEAICVVDLFKSRTEYQYLAANLLFIITLIYIFTVYNILSKPPNPNPSTL